MSSPNVSYSTIIEEIKDAENGSRVLILPDTFLMKVPKYKYRVGNTYAIQHLNKQELLLIDVVHEESKDEIDQLINDGFTVKGLLLTHEDLIHQAYTSLKELSSNLGDAPVFLHPLDTANQSKDTQDILKGASVFENFSIEVYHSPGHTGGSVVIYSKINNGMLFTGDSAIGAPYTTDDFYFERPPIADGNKDMGLAETWKNFKKPFKHILPLHGKPQFDLSEGEQKDIILNLSKDESTKTL